MPHELNLVKLCVGVESVATLRDFVARRGAGGPTRHRTRMRPTRADALLGGGSLYWVIAGAIRCRQRLLAVEPATAPDGGAAVDLVLAPELVETAAWPRRPFQGWRYLKADEAPPDLASRQMAGDAASGPPAELIEATGAVGVAWRVG